MVSAAGLRVLANGVVCIGSITNDDATATRAANKRTSRPTMIGRLDAECPRAKFLRRR
jgi:hypothetical protein